MDSHLVQLYAIDGHDQSQHGASAPGACLSSTRSVAEHGDDGAIHSPSSILKPATAYFLKQESLRPNGNSSHSR